MEIDDRDAAANADMKRLMTALLPDLHGILGRVKTLALREETAPNVEQGIAADFKLWREASERELVTHYNRFEAPLTFEAREREKRENPNAPLAFAAIITELNLQEAITEYLGQQKPLLSADQEASFKATFEHIESLAAQIDTQNVTSLADKVRRDGWKPGGGGSGGPGGL